MNLSHRIRRRCEELVFAAGFGQMNHVQSGPSVFLHVGFRKCGSTAIQELLRENTDILKDHIAIAGRRTGVSTKELMNAAFHYANRGDWAARTRLAMTARNFFNAIRDVSQNAVIVSEEGLTGRLIKRDAEDIFDRSARVLPVIIGQAEGCNVIVVLYTRDRDHWLRSCWNQDVKLHGFADSFDTWMYQMGVVKGWEDGIEKIRNTCPVPVRVVSMEDEIGKDVCLGARVLSWAGVPQEVLQQIEPSSRRNGSLSPTALDFMQQVNRTDISQEAKSQIGLLVRRNRAMFDTPTGDSANG